MHTPEPEDNEETRRIPMAPPTPAQSAAVFDPRIDRLISWVLMLAAGVALSVGAWFFGNLQHGMDELKREVVELKVALKGTESDRRDIEDLKIAIAQLRQQLYELERRK